MCAFHELLPISNDSFMPIAPSEMYIVRKTVTCSVLILSTVCYPIPKHSRLKVMYFLSRVELHLCHSLQPDPLERFNAIFTKGNWLRLITCMHSSKIYYVKLSAVTNCDVTLGETVTLPHIVFPINNNSNRCMYRICM